MKLMILVNIVCVYPFKLMILANLKLERIFLVATIIFKDKIFAFEFKKKTETNQFSCDILSLSLDIVLSNVNFD